jgi:hypothetical protein
VPEAMVAEDLETRRREKITAIVFKLLSFGVVGRGPDAHGYSEKYHLKKNK